MTIRIQALVIGLGWLAAFMASIALSADLASRELLVRSFDPIDPVEQGTRLVDNVLQKVGIKGAVSGLDVVNPSEGLFRLKFRTAEQADTAAELLARSPAVVRVTANRLYRPMIKYTLRDATGQDAAARFQKFKNGFSFETPSSLPDVLPIPSLFPGIDPIASKDWALRAVNQPSWAFVKSLLPQESVNSVITAVIDTGIDYNHEDILGALWRKSTNPQEIGWDFAHGNAKPYDVVKFDIEGCMNDVDCKSGIDSSRFLVNPGHGTHCAGHVGAVANNSKGIRGMGAHATRVMGLKFFFDFGEESAGQGDDAAAIQAIDYAIKNGAKVMSASWGGRSRIEEAEKSELRAALVRAQKAGLLFVVAAGNDGIDNDLDDVPTWPASYELDNIITVAAVGPDDRLADFSSYGFRRVHIGAPGVKVLSTVVGNIYSDKVAQFTGDNGVPRALDWDGTSMATPIVAGAVALVWAAHPEEDYHQIRRRILDSARKVPGLAGKVASGGVLDVAAALK